MSVPQSHEKAAESETELPNPELNPLLNPTLGRNLGRWAQVYFTSPPEKREEAVGELLRELQGQPAPVPAMSSTESSETPKLRITPVETLPHLPGTLCAECGHHYSTAQRFCGMCGAPMVVEEPESPAVIHPREPVFAPVHDFPSLTPVSEVRHTADDSFSDVRWLREKNLSGDRSWGRGPRYAPAILALVAIGVLVYAQWLPRGSQSQKTTQTVVPGTQRAAAPTPQAAPVPRNDSQTPAAPASSPAASSRNDEHPATAAPPTGTTETASNSTPAPVSAPPEKEQTAPLRGSAQAIPTDPESQTGGASSQDTEAANVPSTSNGSQELAQAEEFLNGKKYPRDSAMAAKLLWKAVGKENPSAVLLLSDMYLAGDGVPKSCDQARLLLTAAARKGVPQAADKLRSVLRSDCR
jgi:hypothetical protein